nr:GNAT family N-acetyltransferase [Oceaniglobus trochenteri]
MAHLHAGAMTLPRPWSAAEFAALLATPGTFAIGDSRAFALGRVILDEAELLTLATAPQQRRKGLARTCLAGFHARALSLGATRAFLEVSADNTAARALYDGAGYRQSGLRPRYYRQDGAPPVDAVVMARDLTAA